MKKKIHLKFLCTEICIYKFMKRSWIIIRKFCNCVLNISLMRNKTTLRYTVIMCLEYPHIFIFERKLQLKKIFKTFSNTYLYYYLTFSTKTFHYLQDNSSIFCKCKQKTDLQWYYTVTVYGSYRYGLTKFQIIEYHEC